MIQGPSGSLFGIPGRVVVNLWDNCVLSFTTWHFMHKGLRGISAFTDFYKTAISCLPLIPNDSNMFHREKQPLLGIVRQGSLLSLIHVYTQHPNKEKYTHFVNAVKNNHWNRFLFSFLILNIMDMRDRESNHSTIGSTVWHPCNG